MEEEGGSDVNFYLGCGSQGQSFSAIRKYGISLTASQSKQFCNLFYEITFHGRDKGTDILAWIKPHFKSPGVFYVKFENCIPGSTKTLMLMVLFSLILTRVQYIRLNIR